MVDCFVVSHRSLQISSQNKSFHIHVFSHFNVSVKSSLEAVKVDDVDAVRTPQTPEMVAESKRKLVVKR